MGLPGKKEDALFFVAVTWRPDKELDWIRSEILALFGTPEILSEPLPFAHSAYYEQEMGSGLLKLYCFMQNAYDVDRAVQDKLKAIAIEQQHCDGPNRTVNIDPGYLTLAKLVLTTTKNFDHRIWIGRGIFADIQLRFRGGRFVANAWTYPDYKQPGQIELFETARTYLKQKLEHS